MEQRFRPSLRLLQLQVLLRLTGMLAPLFGDFGLSTSGISLYDFACIPQCSKHIASFKERLGKGRLNNSRKFLRWQKRRLVSMTPGDCSGVYVGLPPNPSSNVSDCVTQMDRYYLRQKNAARWRSTLRSCLMEQFIHTLLYNLFPKKYLHLKLGRGHSQKYDHRKQSQEMSRRSKHGRTGATSQPPPSRRSRRRPCVVPALKFS